MLEGYNEVLTIDEVCEILMIGRNRCYHLLGDGDIPGFRIGSNWKIPKEAVCTFIRNQQSSNTCKNKKPRQKPKPKVKFNPFIEYRRVNG